MGTILDPQYLTSHVERDNSRLVCSLGFSEEQIAPSSEMTTICHHNYVLEVWL